MTILGAWIGGLDPPSVWSPGSLIQHGNGASAGVGSDPSAELAGTYLRLVDILSTADWLGFARAGRQAAIEKMHDGILASKTAQRKAWNF